MKDLKKDIAILVTAVLMTACSSESYPGLEFDQTATDEASNKESGNLADLGIPVRVFASNRTLTARQNSTQWENQPTTTDGNDSPQQTEETTRGSGPFVVPARENTEEDPLRQQRDLNRYKNAVFHLFAFRDYPDDQGPLSYSPDLSKRSSDNVHTDCLLDGYNLLEGLPAKLKENHTGEFHFLKSDLRRDTVPTYSERFTDIGYNFFGVYLDDWRPSGDNAVRTSDRIEYRIPLDGTRDLMAGVAPPLTSSLLDAKLQRDGIELTQDQRNKVLNIGNYSSYASYLGIDPEIHFQHLLTTFQFYAYPADESADNVRITAIEFKARNEATVTVAGRSLDDVGITFGEEKETMYLMDYDHTKTDPDDPQLGLYPYVPLDLNGRVSYDPAHGTSYYQEDISRCTRIGGDIIVAPDSVYDIVIHYAQVVSGTKTYDEQGNLIGQTEETSPRDVKFTAQLRVPHYRVYRNQQTGKNDSLRINYNDKLHEWQYLAGYAYPVRIAVYGLRGLKIETDLDGWRKGDDIEMRIDDPDGPVDI